MSARGFSPVGTTQSTALVAGPQNILVANLLSDDVKLHGATVAVRVLNAGANPIFIDFGTDPQGANVNTSMPVLPNQPEIFVLRPGLLWVSVVGTAGDVVYFTAGGFRKAAID